MSKQFGFALITTHGIYFNKLYYSTAKAIREQWFLDVYHHGEWPIPVLYHERNHHFIEVIYNGEIIMANLLPLRSIPSIEELDKYFIQFELLRKKLKRMRAVIRKGKKNKSDIVE